MVWQWMQQTVLIRESETASAATPRGQQVSPTADTEQLTCPHPHCAAVGRPWPLPLEGRYNSGVGQVPSDPPASSKDKGAFFEPETGKTCLHQVIRQHRLLVGKTPTPRPHYYVAPRRLPFPAPIRMALCMWASHSWCHLTPLKLILKCFDVPTDPCTEAWKGQEASSSIRE